MSAVEQPPRNEAATGDERLDDDPLWSQGTRGPRNRLDPDRAWQRLVHDLEAVRPLANLVRENLEAGRDRRMRDTLPLSD